MSHGKLVTMHHCQRKNEFIVQQESLSTLSFIYKSDKIREQRNMEERNDDPSPSLIHQIQRYNV